MTGYRYVKVPASLVPIDVRLAARDTASWSAQQLSVKAPEIVWLAPADDDDPQEPEAVTEVEALGIAFAPPGHRIGLRHELRGAQLISTTAHEVAHLTGRHDESEADDFGWYVARQMAATQRSA